jgi:hypothetical protein
MSSAVNTIDALALQNLEGINPRLKHGGMTLSISEVNGLVTDPLRGLHFLEELTGKDHLTQYDAVHGTNPNLTLRTVEAPGSGCMWVRVETGPTRSFANLRQLFSSPLSGRLRNPSLKER